MTTTTVPGELQVLTPNPDDALDVLLPEELPATGVHSGVLSLIVLFALLLGGVMVSASSTRRSRHRKSGGR